jgi:8-oxo-dGTP pyrophosphatase MutT (NUDIX family)
MNPPIYKIGICVLCEGRVLLVQPRGKLPAQGAPPFVLPRGTRAWRDAGGTLIDARTVEDALLHTDALEAMRETAKREAHEEAGVPPALFDACDVVELGSMLYHSETGKGSYPIMWFMLQLSAQQKALLEPPADSVEARFFTLDEFATLVAEGRARAGYLEVARRALALHTENAHA